MMQPARQMRLAGIIQQLRIGALFARLGRSGALELGGGLLALRLQTGKQAAFDRGVNRWDGRAQVECVLAGPFTRALHLSLVQDLIEQGQAGE